MPKVPAVHTGGHILGSEKLFAIERPFEVLRMLLASLVRVLRLTLRALTFELGWIDRKRLLRMLI